MPAFDIQQQRQYLSCKRHPAGQVSLKLRRQNKLGKGVSSRSIFGLPITTQGIRRDGPVATSSKARRCMVSLHGVRCKQKGPTLRAGRHQEGTIRGSRDLHRCAERNDRRNLASSRGRGHKRIAQYDDFECSLRYFL